MHIKTHTAPCICCETVFSTKEAINHDKLQGSVAEYLRCGGTGGIVNNQLQKGLLLISSVKKIKSVNIWQSYKQKT